MTPAWSRYPAGGTTGSADALFHRPRLPGLGLPHPPASSIQRYRADNERERQQETSMATKADFTEEEWKSLERGITGTGMLVSVADPGLMDSFGETSALAKYLQSQRVAGATKLMRELSGTHGTGFGVTANPD